MKRSTNRILTTHVGSNDGREIEGKPYDDESYR